VVGFDSGTIPALAFNLPFLKGGALLGVDLAQIRRREPATHARLIAQLFDWLASGKLQPVSERSCRSRIFAKPSRPCNRNRRSAR